MNPQLNKVFSKIAKAENKTELSKHYVELAGIKDLEDVIKQYTDIKKQNQDALKALNKAKTAIQKVEGVVDEANGKQSSAINAMRKVGNLESVIGKFEDAARDLGLDAKKIPAFTKATKLFDEVESLGIDVEDFELPKL